MDYRLHLIAMVEHRRAHIRAQHSRHGLTPYVRALLCFQARDILKLQAMQGA